MQLKYGEDPVYRLYNALDNEIKNKIICKAKCEPIDPILKYVIENNSCKIADNVPLTQSRYNLIDDNEYVIYFIYGALGNDAIEYYDFTIMNGTKILIIFIDYFNIKTSLPDGDDPSSILAREMGNSVYYDAIKKIVEIFYLTAFPISNGLQATSIMNTMRWNQAIIAIHILNKYLPVTTRDAVDMPMEQIKDILRNNLSLQLYGIRVYM